MAEDFIVRIYRFKKNHPRSLVGFVEIVGKRGRLAFTSMDELWEILNLSIGDETEGDAVESVKLGKKRRFP